MLIADVAAKLTKSNSSIPPSADQITKHKDLHRLRDGWQSDVNKLRAIIAGRLLVSKQVSVERDTYSILSNY